MKPKRAHLSRILTLLLCILLLCSLAVPASASSWVNTKIRTSYGNVSTAAYVLDSPAKSCLSFDLEVDVEMKNNTKCANWDIWVRSGGKFVKVDSLSLPGGNGSTTKTVKLKSAKDFDAVAITPTARGSYSWSLGLNVTNISDGSTKPAGSGTSGSTSDSTAGSDDFALLEGDYERVKLRTGSKSYDVHAFVLDTPLKGVRSIGVAINVTMNKNTRCYDWDVWVRSGGSFKKAGSMKLADGSGFAMETITFKKATDFDAVAVIPTVPGGYSWSLAVGLYNPQ